MKQLYYTKFKNALNNFFPFEQNPKIAIAVSGGRDSLTLMLLCKLWLEEISGSLVALTIDHKLRKDSGLEAEYVKSLCKENNIEHHTLEWIHSTVESNMQEKARKARYKLLTDFCLKHDILNIFTGHHLGDEIENFFIRLVNGSGIIGLSAHDITFMNNVRIVKPLKSFSKQEIYDTTTDLCHIEDPSNISDKFLRSRIRKSLDIFLDDISSDQMSRDFYKNNINNSISNLALPAKLYEDTLV